MQSGESIQTSKGVGGREKGEIPLSSTSTNRSNCRHPMHQLGSLFYPRQCLLLPTKMATVHRHLILTTLQEITGKAFCTVDNCPCFSPAPCLCLVFLVGLQVLWMRLRLQTSFVTNHQDISWSESVLLAHMKACLCWQSRLVTMGLFRFKLRLVKDHCILHAEELSSIVFFFFFLTSLEIALVRWG